MTYTIADARREFEGKTDKKKPPSRQFEPQVRVQKGGFTLKEWVEKIDCEMLIVNKKDVERVKFYIRQLNGGGYHDVSEFYKD